MQILEYFYHNPPAPNGVYNRKQSIKSDRTIIKGAIHSGKKTLIYDHLQGQKELLYIDERDMRFDARCYEKLLDFISKNKIQALIINEPSIDPSIIAKLDIKVFLLSSQKDYSIDGFDEIWLDFLDFEEFVSASYKNSSIGAMFGAYLLSGRMLDGNLQTYLRANYTPLQLKLLKLLAPNIGHQTSIRGLYEQLKLEQKISKQSVFDAMSELENNYTINWVNHASKKLKKPYFANFALKDALCVKKDFQKTFENAVLCELLGYGYEVVYDDVWDFCVPKMGLGVVCAPFVDATLARLRIKKLLRDGGMSGGGANSGASSARSGGMSGDRAKISENSAKISNKREYQIKTAVIITNNTSANIDGISVVPFYEWALGL